MKSEKKEPLQTMYFSHCWGVFEGGGVRASAHAGAYAAAREAGVSFERVAGTSGGSIVAALIAAGYDAPQLSKLLEETNFPSFISPQKIEEEIFFKKSFLLKVARFCTWGRWKIAAEIARNSGLHSSVQIESWLQNKLSQIIQPERALGVAGPITFKELRIPLHIVATDLVTGQPKIWSRETTPDDSVALAVRCSCTIPFFFKAVPVGPSLLIDGGVVSNLPSFVFNPTASRELDRGILSEILAFRLCENVSASKKPNRALDFLYSLANAVISSATHIQSSLQTGIYVISINTGNINSTDFEINSTKKKSLHKSGEDAVADFLRKERSKIRTNIAARSFQGFDEKLFLMMHSLRQCNNLFCFSGTSTYWLDFSFLAVLAAARRGVEIICIVPKETDKHELRRRALLSKMGAQIVEVEYEQSILINGFFFDMPSKQGRAVISDLRKKIGSDRDYTSEILRVYTYSTDSAVLQIIWAELQKLFVRSHPKPSELPYQECIKEELFSLLRTIPQYKNAEILMKNIEVSKDIQVLQKSVKEYKVFQMEDYIKDLNEDGHDLFDLKKIVFDDGSYSIVCPPVLEEMDGQLIVIDGNARLRYCLIHGIKNINAIIISNVKAPLPAEDPQSLNKLSVASTTKTLRSNYKNIDESQFRRIDEAVHHAPFDKFF
ncbi:patatin-like phospholipase family protein [Undibacterium sp.]|uniref:patatin-like phospholipase family protein n=1 Tax=Undibacterium sp. TaxID=1914977 RepID=UPI00272F896E|nr:patatin-like phospholipase family protein [Undibacterium sp.]MDP1980690.1 patatin-like phospholipase family protein [Undibacterium sp.]